MATNSLPTPLGPNTAATQSLSKQVPGSSVLLSAASGPMLVFHKDATLAQTDRSPYSTIDGSGSNADAVIRQPCPEGATLLDLYLVYLTTEPAPFPTIRVYGRLPLLVIPHLWTTNKLGEVLGYPENDVDPEAEDYHGWWIPLPSTDEEYLETLGATGLHAGITTDGSSDAYLSQPRTFRTKGVEEIVVLVQTAASSDPDASCIVGHFRK